jgi:L-asparaginase II
MARFGTGTDLSPTRATAAKRLMHACFAAPVLVAGEGRFDTVALGALAPDLFVKGGAEAVHCAALPELGLGIALKIDDGAKRGAERALAEVLAMLLPQAQQALADQLDGEMLNWCGIAVGRIRASDGLRDALNAIAAPSRPAKARSR